MSVAVRWDALIARAYRLGSYFNKQAFLDTHRRLNKGSIP